MFEPEAIDVTPRIPRFVLKVVAFYVAVALLWILLSDQLVSKLAVDLDDATRLSEFKGVMFVVVTAILLYLLLARLSRALTAQTERLHDVAHRYHTLFEHGGESMLVVGADDGIIHDANHAAAEMYGWPIDALIGRPLEELVTSAPDDLSPSLAERVCHWHRTAGGERIPVDLISNAMRWKGDAVHLVVVRHLGDQLEQREKLSRLAHQDPLTGLFNRNLLPEQVRMGVANAQRTGTLFGVCFLDLDGFKAVNDQLGHDAGDELLRQIARRIKAQVRGGDVVVRLGGDEFVILLGELRSLAESEQILRRLLGSIAEPVVLGAEHARVTGSIGVALYPSDGSDHEMLLHAADEAMYRAKEAGRNRYAFHNKAHEDRIKARTAMLDRVARAISEQKLLLFYEPLMDVARGVIEGIEAKMRWHHPVLGILPASEFLPFIKDPALELEVDLWAIGQAQRDIAALDDGRFGLRINLFAPDAGRNALLEALHALATQLGPGRLTVELSPEVFRRLAPHLSTWRDACHAMGVRLSLDGLVAGADSVHSLATLALDEFKLPAEALGLNDKHDGVGVLTASYVAVAQATGMNLVVKGVMDDAQAQWLKAHGCVLLQGETFGGAVDAEHLSELLNQQTASVTQVVSGDVA